jgi:hypothetical protein
MQGETLETDAVPNGPRRPAAVRDETIRDPPARAGGDGSGGRR